MSRILLSSGQLLAALVMFYLFFTWAPWVAARTPEDTMELYGISVPEEWRAVVVEHGHVYEWPLGTISQNPWGFAAWTMLLASCLGFLYWSVRIDLRRVLNS